MGSRIWLKVGIGLLFGWLAIGAQAEQAPHELVESVTADVLKVVRDKKELLNEAPEDYYGAVNDVLSPVIAFEFIAKGVMGKYAKEATQEQVERFSNVFQSDLISTYAKGMSAFGEERIEVLPPKQDISGRKSVSVIQKVYTENGENTVKYSMRYRKKTSEWKLVNVTINGVNLGVTFRSQFAQAMKKTGDLDAVIDEWAAQS